MRFLKMHGLGNDFVLLDSFGKHLLDFTDKEVIKKLADRHKGIGFDQLVLVDIPLNSDESVFPVRFFNSDGSESAVCGNASRAIALFLHEKTGKQTFILKTGDRLLPCFVASPKQITVNMGEAKLSWQDIPLSREENTIALSCKLADFFPAEIYQKLFLPNFERPAALSVGNPHMTFFVQNLIEVFEYCKTIIAESAAKIEKNALFPQGVNIGFAEKVGENMIRLKVYERGTGFTEACGSGACAAAINALRIGMIKEEQRQVKVITDGGILEIEWQEDGKILMTGAATHVFFGETSKTFDHELQKGQKNFYIRSK